MFAFRWTGAALAAAIMGFPLMVRAIRLAIEAVDPRLELAARTLGASRTRVFFTRDAAACVAGHRRPARCSSFARALGEFGATITFVSNIPGETRTLPLAIYTFTQVPGRRRAGAAPGALLGRAVARRAGALRVAGAPRSPRERADA